MPKKSIKKQSIPSAVHAAKNREILNRRRRSFRG